MTDSEFRAYPYILEVLEKLGWDTRNPRSGGQVYTQGEFRNHDSILSSALGKLTPENVILVPWTDGARYWMVEAKRRHRDMSVALAEAQRYADSVNNREADTAKFATGIAGTPDRSFFVTTTYWDGSDWRPVEINGYATTGFLTSEQCRNVLLRDSPHILDYDVDLARFLVKANDINVSLHRNGVAARDRAQVVAALLLALVEDSAMTISQTPRTLVRDVNARIDALLGEHGKADFAPEVSLKLPNTLENHRKYRAAIVETLQHLREMNIRSAITSGTDALGQFYETFLKYANDASEMGIVLTPRHVTKFAVDVLGIRHEDAIFDPTCGTAGFLVAALDAIRASHYNAHRDVYERFRNDCLYGVEQSDNVFGLALVNMIFRGDGKSRIHNGNCFDNRFVRDANGKIIQLKRDDPMPNNATRPFTRVLMNPPFALEEKEHEFVDYALDQTSPGGLLFAVLPNGPITGLNEGYPQWRHELVKRHTVRSVLRMPRSLFHPAADKVTYILILEAWRTHQPADAVFYAHLYDNHSAHRLSKWVNVTETRDNVGRLTAELRSFLAGTDSTDDIPTESGVSKLNLETCDFAPEAYLSNGPDSGRPTPPEGLFVALTRRSFRERRGPTVVPETTDAFRLDVLFEISRGDVDSLKYLRRGETPVITTTEQDNGVQGYYDTASAPIYDHAITVTINGSGGRAFWHPYPFAAVKDVLVCRWRGDQDERDAALNLYVCDAINRNAWRFSWSRKATLRRLVNDARVVLPMNGGQIDLDHIRRTMQRAPGYSALKALLDER